MSRFTKPGLSHSPAIGGVGMCIDQVDEGALLIGNGVDFDLTTLTAGPGMSIVNSPGGITLSASGTYGLPIASATVLGGIKVGSGLSIDGGGVLSNTYALPTASGSVLGGVKIGSGLTIDPTSGVLSSVFGGEGVEHAGTLVGTRNNINFIEGSNVALTVADNPGSNRVDVTVTSTGGGGASTVNLLASAAGQGKALDLGVAGSPPSNWQTIAYDDSAWVATVLETYGTPGSPYADTQWVTYSNTGINYDERWLLRHTFAIPSETLSSVTLKVYADNYTEAIYINEHVISSTESGNNVPTTYSVPIGYLNPGGSNLLAISLRNGAPFTSFGNPSSLNYVITSTISGGFPNTIEKAGTIIGTRSTINFIEGSGVTLTMADNSGSDRVDITIASSGGGGGGGSVTSVDMTVPTGFAVSGNPITTSGTLALTLSSQSGSKVLASPSGGGSGTPAFRALVASDIPALAAGIITSGILPTARGGSGLDSSSAANGNLLIGNGSGFSLNTITAGANIGITNTAGNITISAASPGITGETVKHNGTTVGIRPNINFIDGSNVTLTVADNSGTGAVDVTIASTAGGGNEAIQHNGTLIGTRPTINLIDGSNVTLTVADNSGSNRVDVTVASTGGGGGGLPADVVYTDHFNTFTVEPQTIVVGSNTLSLSSTSVDVSNGGLLSGTLTQGQLLLSKDSSTYASIHMASLISSSVYSVQGEIHTSDVAWNSNGDIPNTGFNIVQNAGLTNGGFGLYYTYSRDGFPVTKIALVTDGSIHFQVGPAGNYPSLISWQDAMVINNSGHITRINNAVPSNGQLLIGTGSGMSLSTLTAGSNVTITNGSGTITIASTGGGGTDVLADGKAFAEHSNTSPSIYDDEFNDASGMSGPVNGLDARWLKHNLGTSTWLKLDDTIAPGCLAFQIPSGQTMDQAIYQNVPAGDFTLQALFDPADISNRQMWFLFIVDTSGNGIGVGWDKDNPQVALRVMSAWQQTGSVQSLTLTADYRPAQFWLKKVGNVYTASVSESRRLRSRPTQNSFTTGAQAFTAAYMGFGRIFDTGGNSTVLLEAFRLT